MFTENGDIRMDIYMRHYRRAEKQLENVQEAKDTLEKHYREEEDAYISQKSLLDARRAHLDRREAACSQRQATLNSFKTTREHAEDDQELAKTDQIAAAEGISELKAAFPDLFVQIDQQIDLVPDIPPEKPDYSKQMALNEAFRRSSSVRNEIVLDIEDRLCHARARLSQLDTGETELNDLRTTIEKRLSELTSQKLKWIAVLCEKDEDLTQLELCVDVLTREANELESIYKAIKPETEVSPDYRAPLAALDNTETKNARRRQFAEKRREMVAAQMRELRARSQKRLKLSPRKVVTAQLKSESSESASETVNQRYAEIKTSYQALDEREMALDAQEASYKISRQDSEREWEAKMLQIEEKHKVMAEREKYEVAIAQEVDEIENLRAIEQDVKKQLEGIQRRIEQAEEERKVHIDKDPEVTFLREVTGAKQERVDTKQANLDERTEYVRNGVKAAGEGEIEADALARKVAADEAAVAALGPKIAEMTDALRTEERLLDEAISRLPVHLKIKVLAKL
jgi:chromosome segregation ATPase